MFGKVVPLPVLGLLIALFSTATQAEPLTLTACGHQDYPPFNWQDGGRFKGAGVDVVTQVFANLGVKVVPVYVGPWKRCLESVRNGKVDVVVAAYATNERKQYTQFSTIPLTEDRKSVFVWRGREFAFDSWEDLKGKRAGIQLGVSFGQQFDDFLAQHVEVTQVAERLQYFKMLQHGRIDFIATGAYIGIIHASRAGFGANVVALEHPINQGYLYVGISKLSPFLEMMPQVDDQLKQLHDNGTIASLINSNLQRYLATIPEYPVDN